MSLLDAFLEDALYDPPIVQQNTYFARRSDGAIGAGTALDPFNTLVKDTDGSDHQLLSADLFDARIHGLSQNITIILGPGIVYTKGTRNGSVGFTVQTGQRIVGAGRNQTTLKIVGTTASTHAFSATPQLNGFELSDLTIDCNTTTGYNRGAVSVTGSNILLSRLRVTNFAPGDAASTLVVVSAAKGTSSPAYSPRNVVVEQILFDTPGTFVTNGKAILIKMEGAVSGTDFYPHQFCCIRNCESDGVTVTNDITCIDPGLGHGLVIEMNAFFNCATGIRLNEIPARDIVVWDNYFYNCKKGLYLTRTTTPTVGRFIVISNEFDLHPDAISTAIDVAGTGTSQFFDQFVCRKNVIRQKDGPTGIDPDLRGIILANISEAIVENNLINNCDSTSTNHHALQYSSCTYFKAFNNQTVGGQLLRAYDATSGQNRFRLELADEVQDSFLAF
jgi:hypothetical protein